MPDIKQPFSLDSEPPYPAPDFSRPGYWSTIPGVGELVYSENEGVGYLLNDRITDTAPFVEVLKDLRAAKDILRLSAWEAFLFALAERGGSYPRRVTVLQERVDAWAERRAVHPA